MDPGKVRDEEPPESSVPSTISPRAVRITPINPSSIPPSPSPPVVRAIIDLLLAAAQCDGRISRRELWVVRKLTRELLEGAPLPDWIERRIGGFEPASFELRRATHLLASLPTQQKRYVLEAVRRVCDSDNAYDLEEERFVQSLVLALEYNEDDACELVIEPASGLNGPVKRAFDLGFALAFLFFAWPVMLLLALCVKVTSKGPVFFVQRRYGLHGREIRVFKFRSMKVMEDGAVVQQATRDDPRMTPIGLFLRRTSLDELPQFINVIRGEMSIVGPRPHAVAHNRFYRTQILEYMLRHKVKPGITGLAQVNGWRGETDTLDKMIQRVAYDLEYIRRQSLWLDIKIVWLTVFGRTTTRNAY